MPRTRFVVVLAILSIAVVGLLSWGCGGTDMSDPRRVVISLFGAMEKNDEATLTHVLDIPELMRSSQQDYAIQTDQPRVFTNPEELLKDMTGDGATKKTWFACQRIISDSKIMGENATVEVTFVDKQASRGYRTTFGLHLKNGEWRIYSFKTLSE
jgi:hypothetical protein